MSQRISVPLINLIPAGDLPAHHASMVEFLAIGAHAVRRGQISPGMKVLVVGMGPIGLGTALFARQSGGDVSVLDFNQPRLEMAQDKFGFDSRFDGSSTPEDVLSVTDGAGYDVVLDATGNKTAIESGFQYVSHGGSYVLVSVVQGNVQFSDPEFHKREMTLIGSRNATQEDFDRVIDALSSGAIDGDALNTHQIEMDRLPDVINDWTHSRDDMIKAIVKI